MKAVITIGRMNPPTKGHLYLLSKVLEHPADIYALSLQGQNLKDSEYKNIFTNKLKSSIINKSSLKNIDKLKILSTTDLLSISKHLNLSQNDKLVLVLGEEDVAKFEPQVEWLKQKENVPSVEIIGIPMKKAEGDTEHRVSGTMIRNFILSNDFNSFRDNVDLGNEKEARKVFGQLRSAVLSNLKNRFPHKEENGKIIFNLPKTKKGQLNTSANNVIDKILSKMKNFKKQIIWENTMKECTFLDANKQPIDIEIIPQPSDQIIYIDLNNPISMNGEFIQSFSRSKRLFPSTIISADGNELNRFGKYEINAWDRLKRSIGLNGFIDPLTVRVDDDLTCCIDDGHHRLHALSEIENNITKVPIKLKISGNVNFKSLNNLIKSWHDNDYISNQDYGTIINQLNLMRVEDVIKAPNLNVNLLKEGGRGGHMAHGYEVFKGKEIFDFFQDIFSGKYEMYEKVDGQNMFWGIDDSSGKAVFDLGGKIGKIFDAKEKYSLYHPAGDAYRAGFQAVREGIERLDPSMIRALGLLDGNMINSEIIYGEIPNVVPYSKTTNYIVLHTIAGDAEVKNEKQLLNKVAEMIGTVLVTSEVINYEGDDLTQVKASITQETSKWKFVGPIKIDPQKIKDELGDIVEKWKEYPEAVELNGRNDLTKEEALRLAKSLSVKISSSVLNKMVSNLRDPGSETIEGGPGIEGIALYGKDNELYKVTGDFSVYNREMWKPAEKIKEIQKEYYRYICQDVLGLKTVKIGDELTSRFGGDAAKYLRVKSSKFAIKRGVEPLNPNSPVNINQLIELTNNAINDLQIVHQNMLVSDNIKKDSIIRSVKITAFKLNKIKNNIRSSKTYVDIVIALAKGQEMIKETKQTIKSILKELFDNKQKQIQQIKNVTDIQDQIVDNSNGSLDKTSKNAISDTRVKPTGKIDITSDNFEKYLEKLFRTNVDQIPANKPQNPSSKFTAYKFPVSVKDKQKDAIVLLTKGGNKGENFEKDTVDNLQPNKKTPLSDYVFKQMGILRKDVKSITQTGGQNSKRKDFLMGGGFENWAAAIDPTLFGKALADCAIKMKNGEEHYISIKDKSGDTLFNLGTGGLFIDDKTTGKISLNPNPEKYMGYYTINKIVSQIDWKRVIVGLSDYKNQTEKQKLQGWIECEINSTGQKYLRNLIACSWGYGYWYLREDTKSPNKIKIVKLTTKEDLSQKLNLKMTFAKIKYPSKLTKALTIRVDFINKLDNSKLYYEFSLRNKEKAKIVPDQLVISQKNIIGR